MRKRETTALSQIIFQGKTSMCYGLAKWNQDPLSTPRGRGQRWQRAQHPSAIGQVQGLINDLAFVRVRANFPSAKTSFQQFNNHVPSRTPMPQIIRKYRLSQVLRVVSEPLARPNGTSKMMTVSRRVFHNSCCSVYTFREINPIYSCEAREWKKQSIWQKSLS